MLPLLLLPFFLSSSGCHVLAPEFKGRDNPRRKKKAACAAGENSRGRDPPTLQCFAERGLPPPSGRRQGGGNQEGRKGYVQISSQRPGVVTRLFSRQLADILSVELDTGSRKENTVLHCKCTAHPPKPSPIAAVVEVTTGNPTGERRPKFNGIACGDIRVPSDEDGSGYLQSCAIGGYSGFCMCKGSQPLG